MVTLGTVKTQHVKGDVWLVTAEGEHDLSVSPSVKAALDDLERHGTTIIVDLTPVEFVDSTVLRGLVKHRDRHGQFVVVVPSGSVARRIFDLCRFDDYRCRSRQDASRHAASPARTARATTSFRLGHPRPVATPSLVTPRRSRGCPGPPRVQLRGGAPAVQ
ncbi:MAG: STAS domain-containing protein [Actinoallomurus sp.]